MNNDVAQWDMIDFNPEEWADEFIRILKPTGNLFIFTSYNQLGRWYNCLDHKFDTSNFMIWHKTNPAPKIFKAGFLNSCEMIFTCWNKKHTWNFISQAQMHNFIESSICMRPERLSDPKHPTQKPISILKKMIEIASNENDIVFDPFMGVGSTGIAAIELNRRFIGVEIDETYYHAAKKRIDDFLEKDNKIMTMEVEEPEVVYGASRYTDLTKLFSTTNRIKEDKRDNENRLQPILKWPGGKEKELRYILPNLPGTFKRYFEPFVGGGSVFMAIHADRYLVNDMSADLMSVYKYIAEGNKDFFSFCRAIDKSLINSDIFFKANECLQDYYLEYREGKISDARLKKNIKDFCSDKAREIEALLDKSFSSLPCILVKEMEKNITRKMLRMRELELVRHELPISDVRDNILTAIRSAIYMNYRYLYNCKSLAETNPELYTAVFLYIRNYAYSGMFRYSNKGEFNVPYGGIAYNSKYMNRKLDYYQSGAVKCHMSAASFYNLDFEEFLECQAPQKDDFVFIDPPYDSDFSTYDRNPFTKEDQIRLAKYLIENCKAKWMMVIKNTEFIYGLYNKEGINIRTFDKEYVVSFMNRNNKKATHLLITNY